jgi:hypothetical protein
MTNVAMDLIVNFGKLDSEMKVAATAYRVWFHVEIHIISIHTPVC